MPADSISPSVPDLQRRVDELAAELREASRREAAVAEILQVTNASGGDLAPVFGVILEKAHSQCGVAYGSLQLYDGETMRAVAVHGLAESFAHVLREGYSLGHNHPSHPLIEGGRFVHIPDMAKIDDPLARAAFELSGIRTTLFIPLRRDGTLLGQIVAARREIRPFIDKEITLLESFAAQAVIAMENARLINELREALEQQTATADILHVISQSPTDVQPVLRAVTAGARRFCGATDALVNLRDETDTVVSAHDGPLTASMGLRRPLSRDNLTGRAMLDGLTVHVPDTALLDPKEYAAALAMAREHKWRAAVAVPMLREGVATGAILLRKTAAGAFTPRQIELLETFAAQSVIAIENARLFTDLRESLDQQTATAEVLRVISQSPTDVHPVLKAVVAAARRFCGAEDAAITLREGSEMVMAAHAGGKITSEPKGTRTPLDRSTVRGRSIMDAATVHMPDVLALDPIEYGLAQHIARTLGFRAVLSTPMLRDDGAIGCITLPKTDPVAFTQRQIELLKTFAAQAVIAIENVRLFTELRESLERQTATTEVLETINSSPGDLQPVFEAILAKAMTLCDAAFGTFGTFDGQRLHTVASRGVPEALARYRLSNPPEYGPGTGPARVIAGEAYVHEIDAADSEVYRKGDPNRRAIVELGGARTILNVALRKDDALLGTLSIYRQEVRPFSDNQIALVQGFAAQAVIAMENARLLGELRDRQAELRVTFDNMGDGVAMFDAEPRLAAWNRNFEQIIGVVRGTSCRTPAYADYLRLLAERGEFGDGERRSRSSPAALENTRSRVEARAHARRRDGDRSAQQRRCRAAASS